MVSLLQQAYPSMRMHLICRLCRGNAKAVLDTNKCGLCRKTNKDYRDANLGHEVEEWKYLRMTWIKCQTYNQNTTGIAKLDLVITTLFGPPHSGMWRNYSVAPHALKFGLNSGVLIRRTALEETC